MTDILLIRHGETAWNAERRLQGHLDIALNEVGHRQAALLAIALKNELVEVVISSDLQRAYETARPLVQSAGVEWIIDASLRERCFGAFEGLRYDEIDTHFPQAHAAWQAREIDARYPAGVHQAETLREFSQRAVASVLSHAQRHASKKIAIITHGGVLDCLYRFSTGMALEKKRSVDIANASVNRFRWHQGALELLHWGDISHLSMPALDDLAQGEISFGTRRIHASL